MKHWRPFRKHLYSVCNTLYQMTERSIPLELLSAESYWTISEFGVLDRTHRTH